MLDIYVNSRLNCRSRREGRELPPTTASLKQYRKIEIPNKIDHGNIQTTPRYINVDLEDEATQFFFLGIYVSTFW
jgi:hypothetical protein